MVEGKGLIGETVCGRLDMSYLQMNDACAPGISEVDGLETRSPPCEHPVRGEKYGVEVDGLETRSPPCEHPVRGER